MTTALPSQPSRGIGDVLRILAILIISTTASQGVTCQSARARAIKIVGQIQRADYEGDRAALKRLYQDLAPFADDKKLGAKVRYWRGFAMWRRALNGFGASVDHSELEQDLKQAVSEFEAATAKDPAFVDAKVGAGSCLFNLVFLYQNDAVRLRESLVKATRMLKEAEAAEPENPRLLWVLGANRWNNPLERVGAQDKAMETYQKGLKAAREHKNMSSDPLTPSWGEPELLGNLAWSNLNRSTPDLVAAERYARSALELVPYWHYVRDILMKQIQAARTLLLSPNMKDLTVARVEPPQSSNIAKDLEKISADWANYWNAKQLDSTVELYAPDAVFLTGQGNRITGRAAIREVFKTALETNTSHLSVRSLVTEESSNLAYDSGEYWQTITPASGGAQVELQGNYLIVFRRQADGKWLIIEHVWTVAPVEAW